MVATGVFACSCACFNQIAIQRSAISLAFAWVGVALLGAALATPKWGSMGFLLGYVLGFVSVPIGLLIVVRLIGP